MDLEFNGYSLTLILLGLLTLLIAVVVFRRQGNAIHSFGYIMVCIAIWAITYGFELASSTLEAMLFWIDIEYIGISYLPAFWIIFVFRFIGKDHWLKSPRSTAIFAFSTLTFIIVCTNDFHHLQYKYVEVFRGGPFPMLHDVWGPWYLVHTFYFYIMLSWGLYLLVNTFRNADPVFKKQIRIILVSALIPWLVNLFYLMGYKPYQEIDLTPFAFILTSLGIGLGLLRFGLFDIVPIARSKVLEAMQEGVMVVSSKNLVVDANTTMKMLLGDNSINLIGKDIDRLGILPIDFKDIARGASGRKIELSLPTAKGKKYFAVTITTIYERNTVYSGYILLFRDVTDRKEAEESLKSLNQLKDKLFSIISHDLRSPLNTLMGIVTMSSEGDITESELKSFMPEISKNLGYTSGLVDNLLYWAKSQLSGETIHPTDFDIYDTVEHVVELFQKVADEKELKIINGVKQYTVIHADENMIQAVFRNLVSNAIKFSKVSGEIHITATNQAGFTSICIRDNGVGIKDEDMNKLFALETFTTRGTINEKGTGLGLLLCKDFIEKNNGLIWAESKWGEGSKFCFKLPNNLK